METEFFFLAQEHKYANITLKQTKKETNKRKTFWEALVIFSILRRIFSATKVKLSVKYPIEVSLSSLYVRKCLCYKLRQQSQSHSPKMNQVIYK